MTIRPASAEDRAFLLQQDHHIGGEELDRRLAEGRVYLAEEAGRPVGWLRWSLFWDNTPFMNLLYVTEPHRGRGIGKALTARFEEAARALGHTVVMTSTVAEETAQHFYYRLGYAAIGGFTLPGDRYEILPAKEL